MARCRKLREMGVPQFSLDCDYSTAGQSQPPHVDKLSRSIPKPSRCPADRTWQDKTVQIKENEWRTHARTLSKGRPVQGHRQM